MRAPSRRCRSCSPYWRFVSVVGPGGMGKTTVAVSVAHALLDAFDNAVYFIDLGGVTDATLSRAL